MENIIITKLVITVLGLASFALIVYAGGWLLGIGIFGGMFINNIQQQRG